MTSGSWETSTLGEETEKIETVDPRKSPENEFQYVDVSSVSNETLQIETPATIFGKDAPSRARRRIQTDDVLFATIRPTLRRIALVPESLDNQVCSTGYYVLRAKERLEPRFIFYHLQTQEVMDRMESLQSGASYPAVNDGHMRETPIPSPRCRSSVGSCRCWTRPSRASPPPPPTPRKNLQNAQELFQRVLDLTLDSEYDSTSPVDLGGLIIRSRGGISIKSAEYSESGVPVLTKGDVKPIGGIKHGGKYVDATHVDKENWPLTTLGDLIVTTRDLKASAPFLGLVAEVPSDRRYIVNQGATFFAIEESRMTRSFFVYSCCSSRYREAVISRKSGSTQVHIRQDDLFSVKLPLPSMRRQTELVKLFDKIKQGLDQLTELKERKLAALAELKQSLLHRAFRGEL